MGELKWITDYQLIKKESILFFHKVLFNQEPKLITKLLTFSLSNSQNHCYTRKVMIQEDHKSFKMRTTTLHMAHFLCNNLPSDI